MKWRQTGFTLLELLFAAVLVSVLVAIALPNYREFVVRSKRSAAQGQMMDIASREQQYLLANRVYADKAALEAGGYALPKEVGSSYSYDITVGTSTVPAFTISFSPFGPQDKDGVLTLNSEGVKAPAAKW
jgi:type IV pilus assembly protein PilE